MSKKTYMNEFITLAALVVALWGLPGLGNAQDQLSGSSKHKTMRHGGHGHHNGGLMRHRGDPAEERHGFYHHGDTQSMDRHDGHHGEHHGMHWRGSGGPMTRGDRVGPRERGWPIPAMRDLSVEDVRGYMERQLGQIGNERLKVGKVESRDNQSIIAEIVTVDGSLVQRIEVDPRHGWLREVD